MPRGKLYRKVSNVIFKMTDLGGVCRRVLVDVDGRHDIASWQLLDDGSVMLRQLLVYSRARFLRFCVSILLATTLVSVALLQQPLRTDSRLSLKILVALHV